MAGTPAKLKVDIVADSRKARDELDGFSSKVAGFAAGVTGAVTTFAIDKVTQAASAAASQLTDAVEKAASLSSALSTAKVNFGEAAELIKTFGENAALSLGLSNVEAVKAANRFAGYARIIGLSGKEAAKFSTDLIALAADLAAFSDLPVEQAINAIGSAFRGERDPIEAFNIIINDAAVKQAYLAKTGEEVTGTLTAQQNVIGTLAAIQERAKSSTGAFTREQDQLGTRSQILGAQLDNLKTKIGDALLPAIESLTKAGSEIVRIYDEAGVAGVWDRVAQAWGGSLDGLRELVANWVKENVPDFNEWAKKASEWLLTVIYGGPNTPSIFERITQLTNAIDQASNDGKNTDSLSKSGSTLGEAFIGGFIEGSVNYFKNNFWSSFARQLTDRDVIANLLIPGFALGRSLGQAIADGIITFIKDRLVRALEAIFDGIRRALGGLFSGLGGGGGGLISGIDGFRASGGPVYTNKAYVVGENGPEIFSPNTSGQIIPNGYGLGAGIISPVNVTINATIPPGVNGYDVGTSIVKQLDDYYQRNGRFPWDA